MGDWYKIWFFNRLDSGSTIPSQSGPGSNGNERVLPTLQIFGTESSLLDLVWYYFPKHLFLEAGIYPLQGK